MSGGGVFNQEGDQGGQCAAAGMRRPCEDERARPGGDCHLMRSAYELACSPKGGEVLLMKPSEKVNGREEKDGEGVVVG